MFLLHRQRHVHVNHRPREEEGEKLQGVQHAFDTVSLVLSPFPWKKRIRDTRWVREYSDNTIDNFIPGFLLLSFLEFQCHFGRCLCSRSLSRSLPFSVGLGSWTREVLLSLDIVFFTESSLFDSRFSFSPLDQWRKRVTQAGENRINHTVFCHPVDIKALKPQQQYLNSCTDIVSLGNGCLRCPHQRSRRHSKQERLVQDRKKSLFRFSVLFSSLNPDPFVDKTSATECFSKTDCDFFISNCRSMPWKSLQSFGSSSLDERSESESCEWRWPCFAKISFFDVLSLELFRCFFSWFYWLWCSLALMLMISRILVYYQTWLLQREDSWHAVLFVDDILWAKLLSVFVREEKMMSWMMVSFSDLNENWLLESQEILEWDFDFVWRPALFSASWWFSSSRFHPWTCSRLLVPFYAWIFSSSPFFSFCSVFPRNRERRSLSLSFDSLFFVLNPCLSHLSLPVVECNFLLKRERLNVSVSWSGRESSLTGEWKREREGEKEKERKREETYQRKRRDSPLFTSTWLVLLIDREQETESLPFYWITFGITAKNEKRETKKSCKRKREFALSHKNRQVMNVTSLFSSLEVDFCCLLFLVGHHHQK